MHTPLSCVIHAACLRTTFRQENKMDMYVLSVKGSPPQITNGTPNHYMYTFIEFGGALLKIKF